MWDLACALKSSGEAKGSMQHLFPSSKDSLVFFCASVDGTGPRPKSLWLAAKGSVSRRACQSWAMWTIALGSLTWVNNKETTPTLLSRSHCGSSKRWMSQPPGPGFKKRDCGDGCSAGCASCELDKNCSCERTKTAPVDPLWLAQQGRWAEYYADQTRRFWQAQWSRMTLKIIRWWETDID